MKSARAMSSGEWSWYMWAAVGTLVSVMSVAIWRWWKERRERTKENALLKGRFGKQVAKAATESEKKPAASLLSGWCPMRGAAGDAGDTEDSDAELDTTYPEESLEGLNHAISTQGGDLVTSVAGMQRIDTLTKQLEGDDDISYSIGELGELHGKLMTADLRNKAKKYEAEMSEEQRKQEAEIRQQQLESIFMLMQQQQDKFGSQDEGDIVEQMKLYSL